MNGTNTQYFSIFKRIFRGGEMFGKPIKIIVYIMLVISVLYTVACLSFEYLEKEEPDAFRVLSQETLISPGGDYVAVIRTMLRSAPADQAECRQEVYLDAVGSDTVGKRRHKIFESECSRDSKNLYAKWESPKLLSVKINPRVLAQIEQYSLRSRSQDREVVVRFSFGR